MDFRIFVLFLRLFYVVFLVLSSVEKVSLVGCHELAAAEHYRVLPAKAEVAAIVTVASDAFSIPGDEAKEQGHLRQVKHHYSDCCEDAESPDGENAGLATDEKSGAISHRSDRDGGASVVHATSDSFTRRQMQRLLVDSVADDEHIIHADSKHHWWQDLRKL